MAYHIHVNLDIFQEKEKCYNIREVIAITKHYDTLFTHDAIAQPFKDNGIKN